MAGIRAAAGCLSRMGGGGSLSYVPELAVGTQQVGSLEVGSTQELLISSSRFSGRAGPSTAISAALAAAGAAALATCLVSSQVECASDTAGDKVGKPSAVPQGGQTQRQSTPGKPLTRRKLARRNSMRKKKRHYQYVIVGAGTTCYAAIEAIRAVDANADILIVSDQAKLPRLDLESEDEELIESETLMDTYNEWRRHVNSRLESEPDAYSTSPLTLLLGKSHVSIDVEKKILQLKDGSGLTYDKILLASAGAPRDFYVLDSSKISYALRDRINSMTTLQDFIDLDSVLARDVDRITVVGGGFLGTEVACALNEVAKDKGITVSQVFVESDALQRYLPSYLSQFMTRKLREVGVDVRGNRLVTGLHKTQSVEVSADGTSANAASQPLPPVTVSMMGWEKENLFCDYVVLASTHIKPKTGVVSQEPGIEIDANNGGIVVNAAMEAVGGLYVAGNLASYYDVTLGRRRVDRYEHAINSGLVAGHNMASSRVGGNQKLYTHSPGFRSRLPNLGVECRGK